MPQSGLVHCCWKLNLSNYLQICSQDPKLKQIVSMGAQEPLEDKTLTVCYGSDFVNPNFVNFCCSNKETAEVRSSLHGATCGCAAHMYYCMCSHVCYFFFRCGPMKCCDWLTTWFS